MRIFSQRKYKSGSKWSLWRWTDIFLAGTATPYLSRLHIVQTPFGAIMLHWINSPDPQSDEHDHPVTFISLLLRGSYDELRNGRRRTVRWLNFIRASDQHRITATHGRVLTLALASRNLRPWGFHTTNGWVAWREYKG